VTLLALTFQAFCNEAIGGGAVVAMVLICAIQYGYHLYGKRRAGQVNERLCRQIDTMQQDLHNVNRDWTLTVLENQLLREFTGDLDLDRTLEHLVRRLASEKEGAFAAYVALDEAAGNVTHVRGLSDRSRLSLKIEPSLLERVAREGLVTLSGPELVDSDLFQSLSAEDRTRSELFLGGIGEPDHLVGVVVTTTLIPAGAPRDEQIELARRLLQSVTGIVKHAEELQERDRQLQSINEIMELRAVTDQKHSSPLDMIESFVDRLREMMQADRAVLFLINPEGGKETYKLLCRCGLPLAPSNAARQADYEKTLAAGTVAAESPELFDSTQLKRLGIDSLIGAALLAPVLSPNGIAGVMCLTRQSNTPFAGVKPDLIVWAARYLSETLLRALHQTVAEWHARQDSLTELFNRRAFDREFAAALQSAAAENSTCVLLMIDIDRFKQVNDTYGHLVGDEVLRSVSKVLKEAASRLSSGTPGLAARFGGEEFAILLPGISTKEAAWIGESIRTIIEVTPITTQKAQVHVTVSGGVSAFPEHGRTAMDLIAAADGALYEAKENGRNKFLIASAAAIA
jgi:diguanylate cyclase (GGDEF)-like protein